jgi:hypothetical protein
MSRSTFEGPILSGDSRFGPLRNVGYTQLVQNIDFNFANTTGNGSAGYPGGNGQFVNGNLIPNTNAVVYTPSASVSPPVAATITADAATTVYRGAVMYLPQGCQIVDAIVDVGTAVGTSGATLTAASVLIGNAFNASTYATTTLTVATNAITAGRYTPTYSGANLIALQSTTQDITQTVYQGSGPGSSIMSQVVFTLVLTGTTTPAPNAGTMYFTLRYVQPDNNIGTLTTYPYGNFD